MSKALEILLGIVVVVLVGIALFALINADGGFMAVVGQKITQAINQITW